MPNDDGIESAVVEVNFKISKSQTAERFQMLNDLIAMCGVNVDFYKNDNSFVGSKMCSNFEKLKEFLTKSLPVIKEIESFSVIYDYDEKTPGNGYRSFTFIFHSGVQYSMKVCQYITENRRSLLFRKSLYLK